MTERDRRNKLAVVRAKLLAAEAPLPCDCPACLEAQYVVELDRQRDTIVSNLCRLLPTVESLIVARAMLQQIEHAEDLLFRPGPMSIH